MTKNKQTLKQTLQLIIDILSFETSDKALERQLSTNLTDWDSVVTVASKHLVLPAIYCRLQQKSLLNYLPADLKLYLEELTQLNRDRNTMLLDEVKQISNVLHSHKINHVFIKGIALLVGNYFQDIGERMIGDIDILIADEDIDNAFELLTSKGYTQSLPFNYEVKNYRHRPRQISDKRLGAIELHDQLLKHGYNTLIDKQLLLSSKTLINDIAIPNKDYLISNTIYAQQINDRTYYYNTLRLKGIYDVLVAGLPQNKKLINTLSQEKFGRAFLNLASVFDNKMEPNKMSFMTRLHKHMYLMSVRFPKLGTSINKVKYFYKAFKDRLLLIILNKSYRKYVLENKLF